MKVLKLTFVLLLLVSISFAQTQNLEHIFSRKHVTYLYNVLEHEEQVYLYGSAHGCGTGYVACMENSDLVFEVLPDTLEGFWVVSDMVWHEDVDIVIGTGHWNESYDYGSLEDGLFLFGITPGGDVLFQEKFSQGDYPDLIDLYSIVGTSLCVSGNGDVIVAAGSNLLWFNADGELLNSKLGVTTDDILHVSHLNNGNLLIHTGLALHLSDSDGDIQQTLLDDITIFDSYTDDQNFYLLTEESVFIYNLENGTTITTSDFLNSIEEPKGISGNESSLFIFQKWVEEASYIQLDKSTLEVVATTQVEEPTVRLLDLHPKEDSMYLVGTKTLHATQSFIKTVPIAAAPEYDNYDISVDLTVTQTMVPRDSFLEFPPPNAVYRISFSQLHYDLEITNQGDYPVNSFTYLSRKYSSWQCFWTAEYVYIEGVNILPGESYIISDSTTLPSFGNMYYNEGEEIDLPDWEVCAFAPNHRFDQDLSNNCDSEVSFVVSSKELMEANRFEVYPNPARETVNVSAVFDHPTENMHIEIFNLLGQQYFYKSLSINTTTLDEQISVADFPTGVYFLRLSDGEGGELVRRFLVAK